MKVTYQSATISFCVDLTDPDALSLPVATLLVGATDLMRFAAVSAVVPGSANGLDPISLEVLSDVPALIKDHVDAVLAALPADVPIDRILTTLHRRLRNSLYVAEINKPRTIDATATGTSESEIAEDMAEQLLGIAVRQMRQTIARAAKKLLARLEPTSPIGRSMEHAMPSRAVWPITGHRTREEVYA